MRQNHPSGVRVHVWSGDRKKDLGNGTYVGDVEVYFIVMPDGSLRSAHDAEKPPARRVPAGCAVRRVGGNPKIVLDSGRTVYGCQVWWEEIIPTRIVRRTRTAIASLVMPGGLSDEGARDTRVVLAFLRRKEVVRLLARSIMKDGG